MAVGSLRGHVPLQAKLRGQRHAAWILRQHTNRQENMCVCVCLSLSLSPLASKAIIINHWIVLKDAKVQCFRGVLARKDAQVVRSSTFEHRECLWFVNVGQP